MLKALKKGSPKVFSVLADRGYGKIAERLALEGPEDGPPNFDLHVHFVSPKDRRSRTSFFRCYLRCSHRDVKGVLTETQNLL
jgi:hypothetical protein